MLSRLTLRVRQGKDIGLREGAAALEAILGESDEEAIADFLVALSDKGETPDEVAGFAQVMRRHAVSIRSDHERLVDTAGTGGGRPTFNVSTTAAFVIAGAGVPVAKHGNRAVTSSCGSADVLSALGVNVDVPPGIVEDCLREIGIAFLFAPAFHPAMKRVARIRRRLGRRTIFNLLGPLTNPAGAQFQVIGVFDPGLTETLAQALALLGVERAWVVHSDDGLDELSAEVPSRVSEVTRNTVRTFRLDPRDYGFEAGSGGMPRGGGPKESAALTRAILEGQVQGVPEDVVVINAAAAIHLVRGEPFEACLESARESLDSGRAFKILSDLIEMTKGRGRAG